MPKIVISNIREGTCDVCLEPVIGYEAKIDKFSAFLCEEDMRKQFTRRKELHEAAERPLLAEETSVAARKTA